MQFTTYLPLQHLHRAPAIHPGGLCWVLFFDVQDVASWPEVSPTTGTIVADLVLRPGAKFYSLHVADKDRIYKESSKGSGAGDYVEHMVQGYIGGSTLQHITATATMLNRRFGVIVKERNGEQRLIGNADAGAKFQYDYTSGDNSSSRRRNLSFYWEHALPAPIYEGGAIVTDGQVIPIGQGSEVLPIGSKTLQLHIRFQVGTPESPMLPGDSIYSHPDMANRNVLVFADGIYLTQIDNTGIRRVVKDYGTAALEIPGGVSTPEVIEIFIY